MHPSIYQRYRLALPKKIPTSRPFDRSTWATLPDNDATPVAVSLGAVGGSALALGTPGSGTWPRPSGNVLPHQPRSGVHCPAASIPRVPGQGFS
ncbi:hypothetical protein K3G63_01530 [Hymenobacter sp. HSC-4F20]|uniref:hypothetical protein n=1 Tax=Hymenobacter sp. HSC-4F20 TaxID=2864135 RepID=UPI001C72E0FD|nr:hypothetical protein [Hymenobacter sp. HSC-4F20]MBX0289097.1 hypothetical protein [Hymenobacter sp. HSC-4F20]